MFSPTIIGLLEQKFSGNFHSYIFRVSIGKKKFDYWFVL